MKRLLVMRHAKSDWYAGGTSDHDRPLNRRGVGSARTMGEVLTRAGLVPDRILTSTAARAETTARLAAETGGWDCPVVADRRLYEGYVDAVLAVIAETPPDVECLMVVGHQPTWGALVEHLTGAAVAIRTATVAVVDLMLDREWDVRGHIAAELSGLLQPRWFTAD